MKSMNRTSAFVRGVLLLAVLGSFVAAEDARGQAADTVTVGTVAGNGVVDVPVYVRDASGTPLGIDQPAGSRIQSYSIRVTYSPAVAVQSIAFARAGITAPLTPTFESSPAAPGSISLLDNFDEATNLIPFTSNAVLPGDQVAHLFVTVAHGTAPGTLITLTLDPVLTQLTDEGGTPATVETVNNGRLVLVSGSVLVTAVAVASAIPMLPPWALALLAVSLAVVAVRMRIF
jgi:hypothetical protein